MKIVIFTADFGNGHNSVARFIAQKYEKEGHEVEIIRPHRLENKIIAKTSENMFAFFSKNSKYKLIKGSYGIAFNVFSQHSRTVFSTFGEKKIKEAIRIHKPDLVLFTFPYQTKNLHTNSITVVTDYGFSKNWYNESKAYIVGNEDIKKDLLKMDENLKIYNIGIPISDQEYEEHVQGEENIRDKYFVINLGALGICNFKKVTNLMKILVDKDIKIILICGKNKKLQTRFEKYVEKKGYNKVEVNGFVNNLDEIYCESFLMFTKAGGVTITEAIMHDIPLLIDEENSMLGQESMNIDFIKNTDIGVILKSERLKKIEVLVDEIMEDYDIKLENIKKIKSKYTYDKDRFETDINNL